MINQSIDRTLHNVLQLSAYPRRNELLLVLIVATEPKQFAKNELCISVELSKKFQSVKKKR